MQKIINSSHERENIEESYRSQTETKMIKKKWKKGPHFSNVNDIYKKKGFTM